MENKICSKCKKIKSIKENISKGAKYEM